MILQEKQNSIILTKSAETLFESYNVGDILCKDAKLSIYFETLEIMEDSMFLLKFNCPELECDYMGNGWDDLRFHTRAEHGKLMWSVAYVPLFLEYLINSYFIISTAIFASSPRKYFHMNIYCILQQLYPFTCHL